MTENDSPVAAAVVGVVGADGAAVHSPSDGTGGRNDCDLGAAAAVADWTEAR